MMKIRTYGDPVLRRKAQMVTEITDELKKLIKDMFEVMHQNDGIGLAATQIGVEQRVIVTDAFDMPLVIINPEIVMRGGEEIAEEGCLSFPGIKASIKRAKDIMAKGLGENGEEIKLEVTGIPARVIQHEVDHLNGILIVDRMIPAERDTVKTLL
ncbi:peptide deformylase [candidate division NPL-UPA2 bacterium Unc8]|uniref:Peptide deformylase n=1 Tax=candidate division NPL-UPA2 bacterium Unc8 TaxID=1980939 RepID=A0A399FXG4_UNCN2|nr:MAG: peptide deformylase [candidate division NPL-UPA2 bacterium Unc8]